MLPRMASMLVLLAVLWMTIQRARDPNTWTWFAARESDSGMKEEAPAPSDPGAKALSKDSKEAASGTPSKETLPNAKPESEKPEVESTPKTSDRLRALREKPILPEAGEKQAKKPTGENAADAKSPVAGKAQDEPGELPLDEDPDELDKFRENMEAVVIHENFDKIDKTEMAAYWQLMSWAKDQPLESLKSRARRGLVYNDFKQTKNAHRGKLVRLDLNVRRVLSYPAEKGNPAGVEQVYELWGWTKESQAWLYCVVTNELPPGMQQGVSVDETVSVYGYFMRMMTYQAGDGRPKARPLEAPLFIGRIERNNPVLVVAEEPNWIPWVAGGVAVIVVGAFAGWYFRPRPKPLMANVGHELTLPLAELVDEDNPNDDDDLDDEDDDDDGGGGGRRRPDGGLGHGGDDGGGRSNWRDERDLDRSKGSALPIQPRFEFGGSFSAKNGRRGERI